MLNQKPFIISGPDMEGLWDRDSSIGGLQTGTVVPKNGFRESKQVRYFPWGCKTRQGYEGIDTDAAWTAIRQIEQYSTNNVTTGAVVSGYLIVSGNSVYDSASPTPGTSIYAINSNNYISIITIFGKIFITEHDLNIGENKFVQIYIPGSGVPSRSAGGDPADIGGATFVSSGTAGNVTQGVHVFGIAYETDSGHITQIDWFPAAPTLSSIGAFTLANAAQQVTATGLPVSLSTAVTKRHILGSRVIATYSGDPSDYELFFITSINDNTTTTLTFNFTDESLVDSADYLYDILVGLPCGVGFTWYSNRLISYGEDYFTLASVSVSPSTLRVSLPGKPEAFSSVDGFTDVFKDDGEYGLKNVFEQDGLLACLKDNKTYATRDNGGVPNTWEVASIDYTLGSTVYGVSKAVGTTGSSKSGKTIVATRGGVFIFQGQYLDRALTWKIENRWRTVAERSAYPLTQIIDIAQAKLFLVKVGDPDVEGDPITAYWLVCDYSLGLSWDKVRWSEWRPVDPARFMTLHTGTNLYFVSGGTDVHSMTIGTPDDYTLLTDNGTRIPNCEIRTAEFKFDESLNQYQISGMRLRGKASAEVTPPGSVSGIIGDAVGEAGGESGGFEGHALLCRTDGGGQFPVTPVDADINGNFSIPDVPAGSYNLIVWNNIDSAYNFVSGPFVVVGGENLDLGSHEIDTLGAHPDCPLA